ncbi:MAG: hypothetical protein K2P59_02240 [Acetatifactor sp.]|nr:hypothetical protein [Acetatifactor sp.]
MSSKEAIQGGGAKVLTGKCWLLSAEAVIPGNLCGQRCLRAGVNGTRYISDGFT